MIDTEDEDCQEQCGVDYQRNEENCPSDEIEAARAVCEDFVTRDAFKVTS